MQLAIPQRADQDLMSSCTSAPASEAAYKAHFEERKDALAKLGAVFVQDSMVRFSR